MPTGCLPRASSATTGAVPPCGQAGSSCSCVTQVWIAAECCWSGQRAEKNSQVKRKTTHLSGQIDRHPPLASPAPHQPRPARDAAHALERGGVVDLSSRSLPWVRAPQRVSPERQPDGRSIPWPPSTAHDSADGDGFLACVQRRGGRTGEDQECSGRTRHMSIQTGYTAALAGHRSVD